MDEPVVIHLLGGDYTIAGIALLLMAIGILLPSANYSLKLRNPRPAKLLVAICIALFSAVVFLWILVRREPQDVPDL